MKRTKEGSLFTLYVIYIASAHRCVGGSRCGLNWVCGGHAGSFLVPARHLFVRACLGSRASVLGLGGPRVGVDIRVLFHRMEGGDPYRVSWPVHCCGGWVPFGLWLALGAVLSCRPLVLLLVFGLHFPSCVEFSLEI